MSYTAPIPVEIWNRCWSYCPSRRLQRLALVCHLFRDICQPLLFSEQTFQAPDVDDITAQNWTRLRERIISDTGRLSQIRASHHLSAVCSLRFTGSFELGSPENYPEAVGISQLNEAYLPALRSFRTTLSQYSRLSILFLSNLTIDTPFRHALSALPRLVYLTLEDCDIACRLAAPLPLRHLTISGSLSEQTGPKCPLRIVSPQVLRSMYLLDTSDTHSIFVAFVPGTEYPDLTTLKISLTTDLATRFFAFLHDCPRLEQLEILSAPPSDSIEQDLASSAIPLLNSFSGPISLAEMFVCGRPVTAAHLTLAGDEPRDLGSHVMSVLRRIAQNSVPLKSLGIHPVRGGLAVFAVVYELFPRLTKLGIRFFEERGYYLPNFSERGMAEEDEEEDGDSDADEEYVEAHEVVTEDGVSIRIPEFNRFPKSPIIAAIEVNSAGLPQHPPTYFTGLMDWLCLRHAELPPRLQELSLWSFQPTRPALLSVPQQRRAIIMVSSRLPELRVLRFSEDGSCHWHLRDGVWSAIER
ncbi:hypothetical protein B0H16DRAFT_1499407 [Mycena metata]|uniref:F-box domain-containing protein n=1 Tax=Mycena metata TaxID=1033252 RepID=A0AAD7K999_9AGAR|nr:hypothetical protein B0H16DRAFT_1499407 [Mycena metata]